MSRNLPSNLLANVQLQNGENAYLFELLTSTVIRVTNADVDLTYGGNVFTGRQVLGFNLPKESFSLNAGSVNLVLSGVDVNNILNLQSDFYGKTVNIYLVSCVNGQVNDGTLVYKGQVKNVNAVSDPVSKKNRISVSIANPLFDFEKVKGQLTSDASQRRNYAGDTTFEFVVEKSGVGNV